MKKKLFLDSTDVHQITGLSMRSAQNMMQYIRTERNLGNQRVIGIFDFAIVFNLPVTVVFDYVNTDIYKKGPMDDEAIRRTYQKKSLEDGYSNYLYHKDFDICMTPSDLKTRISRNKEQSGDIAS